MVSYAETTAYTRRYLADLVIIAVNIMAQNLTDQGMFSNAASFRKKDN